MLGALTNPWSPDAPWVLDALRDSEFDSLQLLLDSSNYVFLARLVHPEQGVGLGVYKPARGERPLSDFPYGTLHHREVAAFELAQALAWNLVPPTIEREGPQGLGSLQLFIEHDPADHYFAQREHPALHAQLTRLAVFDLVANNADRKGGHVLRGADDRLWAIDNGLCFHREEKLRTVIWDFAGSEVPEALAHDLARLRDSLERTTEGTQPLLTRLDPRERAALVRRIDALLSTGALPEMYPWRCTPWPLI